MQKELKTVISGSFRRHLIDIRAAFENFKKSSVQVLAPLSQKGVGDVNGFVLLTTDDPKKSPDVLEKEFMGHIAKADFLYIANIKGYVGQSTGTEMCAALLNGIPIVISEEMQIFSEEIPKTVQRILKGSVFHKLPINNINEERVADLDFSNHDPIILTSDEVVMLHSLVDKLLESLKLASMTK